MGRMFTELNCLLFLDLIGTSLCVIICYLTNWDSDGEWTRVLECACITAAQSCTNGMVRLVDGPVESAGRVEVCINGVWGRVCFDLEWLRLSWASAASDSRVVCRQLGYTVNTGGSESVHFLEKFSDIARSQILAKRKNMWPIWYWYGIDQGLSIASSTATICCHLHLHGDTYPPLSVPPFLFTKQAEPVSTVHCTLLT